MTLFSQVTLPFVAMKGGSDSQKYVDLLIPSAPAKLRIIQGEGPLHLVGSLPSYILDTMLLTLS